MVAWHCKHCGWEGFSPSFTDASDLRPDVHGNLVMDRRHEPVCPRCFEPVVTVREAQARELRKTLIGIALVQ